MADEAERNVEVLKTGFEAINERGVEGMLAFIDQEFEVTTPAELASEPDTYRGHDGVRRYFDSFEEAMENIRFEGHDFIPVGVKVVVPFTLRATGRTTGIEASQDAIQVWELRDGKAIRMELFTDLEEAMAAARGEG